MVSMSLFCRMIFSKKSAISLQIMLSREALD